jgi:hypothetical protein
MTSEHGKASIQASRELYCLQSDMTARVLFQQCVQEFLPEAKIRAL